MSPPEFQLDSGRLARLLDHLIAQSDAGEIKWEPGSPEDSYAADVGRFRLRMRSTRGDGQPPFLFEMTGRPANLSVQTGMQSSDPTVDEKIVALYQRGRAAVLDPNSALRLIEQDLGLARKGGAPPAFGGASP